MTRLIRLSRVQEGRAVREELVNVAHIQRVTVTKYGDDQYCLLIIFGGEEREYSAVDENGNNTSGVDDREGTLEAFRRYASDRAGA